MPAFEKHGHAVLQVYSRQFSNAAQLANNLNSCTPISDLRELSSDADYYFVLVNDDVIPHIANQIRSFQPDACIVHASGVLDLSALPDANGGIFYPLFSFSPQSQIPWDKIPILITSDRPEIVTALTALAGTISLKVQIATPEEKKVLHVSAVFASNFSNHMLAIAEKICQSNNVSFELLKPLIEGTIRKALDNGAAESQTGPALRGDLKTMSIHEEFLTSEPAWNELYKLISRDIIRLTGEN